MLPLIERHFGFDRDRFTVIEPSGHFAPLMLDHGIRHLQVALTPDTYAEVLRGFFPDGRGMIVNLSEDVDPIALMTLAQEIEVQYLAAVLVPRRGRAVRAGHHPQRGPVDPGLLHRVGWGSGGLSPACHSAYHPCSDAILSLHAMNGAGLRQPDSHILTVDEMDHVRCLEVQRPYRGRVECHCTDWTPLLNWINHFAEDRGEADPWQFTNFLVV